MRICLESSTPGTHACLDAVCGQTFAQAIWLNPCLKPRTLCAGQGHCGLCRICFVKNAPEPTEEEVRFLSRKEIGAGWRLGCRHKVPAEEGEIELILPDDAFSSLTNSHFIDAKGQSAFLGIDLGTTSVHWRCVSPAGEKLAEGIMPNPQAASGPDVVSRLTYSMTIQGRDQLADLVRANLAELIYILKSHSLDPERLCVAANSVMTHIFLKCDINGLLHAPYVLTCPGGQSIDMELGDDILPCIIPPLPAPFVGGDISAGMLAILDAGYSTPLLLADLGTNAELALLMPQHRLFLASVPLGPAMEGIGPECGRPASPGVAIAFTTTASGLIPRFYDDVSGNSISATGYLSLFSQLLDLGLMDRNGHFTRSEPAMPVARRIWQGLGKNNGQDILKFSGGFYVTSNDIELLLKIKAIFRVALARLLKTANLKAADIQNFILSGAISEHANIQDLKNLAFIPHAMANKLILGGNTSLDGACLLAENPARLSMLNALCDSATIIDMANDQDFLNDYLTEMTWQ